MLEQTQSLNWEKVQNALKKGLVHLEPSIGDDIPKNEKWDYSVVLKTGHTIGANISKNGDRTVFKNIKGDEIAPSTIVAWEKHQKIDLIEDFNPFKQKSGQNFW